MHEEHYFYQPYKTSDTLETGPNCDKTEVLILYSRFRLPPRLPSTWEMISSSLQIRRVISASFSIIPKRYLFISTKQLKGHSTISEIQLRFASISMLITNTDHGVLGHAFINSKLDFCNSLLHGHPKNEFNKL